MRLIAWISAAGLAAGLSASELRVRVTGITTAQGEIGCSLYRSAAGFPMDAKQAEVIWMPAKAGSVECRFSRLQAGAYAVAVSHDRNGNRKTDTSLLGMPKEDWGVSQNARSRLRAPRFEEARFDVVEGEDKNLEVRIGR